MIGINSIKTKVSGNKWKNRILFLFGFIVLVFISFNLFQSLQINSEVNQEIALLEEDIQILEKDRLELKELIEYFNSTAYIEEKARVDLGLKKEGEKVVIVTNEIKNSAAGSLASIDGTAGKKGPSTNPQKWLKYFFD